MSDGMIDATRESLAPPAADPTPPIVLRPQVWRDARWLGEISGYTTSPDMFAGAWLQPDARRTISRLYAAACADLAQATLGGLSSHSKEWERWFAALRATARQLSPAQAGTHVVRRALHHGQRLEGAGALWGHQLRRGFAALLAASLPDPVPALIGEDLSTFQAHDAAWLDQNAGEERNSPVDTAALAPQNERTPADTCTSLVEQLEIQLTENLQRSELSPIQEARAYNHLIEAGANLAGIARAVGVPASRVRERLTLLDLDQRVQDRVHRGDLPLRVGLALVPLRDQVRQRRLASIAVRRRLTVVQVRQLVEHALSLPPLPARTAPLPADDEPSGGGLSTTRLAALDALRAEADRTITFGRLAALASDECGACGLESAPTVCAECPNLHLLRAVLRHRPRNAA
jgi:hypothetical protein